jgi:hypothetical protein
MNYETLSYNGGIADHNGLHGLSATMDPNNTARVINFSIGDFVSSPPPGPSKVPGQPPVVSVLLQNLPQRGPWAMHNGPKAVQAAKAAIVGCAAVSH